MVSVIEIPRVGVAALAGITGRNAPKSIPTINICNRYFANFLVCIVKAPFEPSFLL
jgi:hypothetical protein